MGKNGRSRRRGCERPFCALIRLVPGTFLSTGNSSSFNFSGRFNCYNFGIGQDQQIPPFSACASFGVAHRVTR
jgi:hypothetical protein